MIAAAKTTPNEAQLAAIRHEDGPLLIIAGPGSGKTFTLVERIVYLIAHKGESFPPWLYNHPRYGVCCAGNR